LDCLRIIHQLNLESAGECGGLFEDVEIVPKHDFVGTVAEVVDLLNW
jgi:hypothetical protein